MLSYNLSWLIFPLPVTLETLSLLLCLLPESALSPYHATSGRGIHSLIHWTSLNTQSLFYSVKKGGGGGMIQVFVSQFMLSNTLSWLIFPWPVILETLSLLLCLLPESALSPNHATLGRGIHSIHWTGLNTQLLCYSVKKGGGTYDPGICVFICYVILHFKLTNISIICNSWVSFPVSLCLLPESALSPHHTTLGLKNIPNRRLYWQRSFGFWVGREHFCLRFAAASEWQIREMQTTDWIGTFIVLYTTVFVNTRFWLDARWFRITLQRLA